MHTHAQANTHTHTHARTTHSRIHARTHAPHTHTHRHVRTSAVSPLLFLAFTSASASMRTCTAVRWGAGAPVYACVCLRVCVSKDICRCVRVCCACVRERVRACVCE